ncbi:MAG: DUF3047 domain-containing protein, partial [Fibrobacter sp.]|nr:DUF3047 domain-containing protein [Fibrobacter sp.]
KWRVHKLPEGGDETVKSKNDSGAGIYVIFKGQFRLNTVIKYVWSSTLPKGTSTFSRYNGRTAIIVLRNASDSTGTWFTEKVNVYKDYERVFGKIPPVVEGIGILSDADNTKTEAAADYGEIRIMEN